MLAPNAILQNRYRIVRPLGQGGMGAVYLSEDRRFGSQVALKETLFEKPSLRKAFEREAGLLHRLRHPALPVVMDYFAEGRGQYLVMQFIPGKDLEQLLEERKQQGRGPFPADQVWSWADRLLDALEYLHGHQPPIVHRDIKPANLKLTPRGEVILLDFGLAKGAVTGMAQAGSLHGYSLNYSPLEQMEGTGTDARSDLYALAATMHHLLTGEVPPAATSRVTASLKGKPDPLRPANEINPQVPAEMAMALARALAQQPDERPATATEMRRRLREVGQSLAPGGDPTVVSEPQPDIAPPALLDEETQIDDAPQASEAELPNTLIKPSDPPVALPSTMDFESELPTTGEGQAAQPSANPLWLMLSALLLAFAFALAALISFRFLRGAPDIAGLLTALSLGLLCLLGGSAFARGGRQWIERGLARFGVRLKFHGAWRVAFTFAILLIVGAFYFSLPSVARVYNERAVRFQQAGNLPAAIRSFERAVSLHPDYAVGHYNLANVYEDVLEFDLALAEYQSAVRADPKFYFAHNNLARLYLAHRRDHASALRILNPALELKPPEPLIKHTLYKNRGWAHLGLGLYDLAVEDLNEALKWREDGAAAHCLLAQALEARKKNDLAMQEWVACAAYAPGEADVEASWTSMAEERLRQGDKK